MDSVLRPRDIQARIRSGESPESVAAAAQTTVEKIMGFATPVLAERAYVAEQAQKASVRRRAGDGAIGTLGQAVAARLTDRDVDPESVEWDAWRREDGRWTLVADYGAGHSSRRASFVYDTAGRYVVADDEESRWLVGERLASAPASPSPAPDRDQPRRLSAVGSEQVSLGDDAIEVVTGQRPAVSSAPAPVSPDPVRPDPVTAAREDPTVDLTEASSVVRSPRVSGEPEALFDAPAPSVVPPRQADAPTHAADEPADESAAAPTDASVGDGDDVDVDVDEPERSTGPQPRKPSRGRGRASVPSWDEIMFGSSRGE